MQNALALSLLKTTRKDVKIMIREDLKMTEEQLARRKAYQKDYIKNMYKRFTLRVKITDVEIIEKLDSLDNYNEYVKNLILADIKKEAK